MGEKLKLPSVHVGTIVEWRDAQGFGFLELGNARVRHKCSKVSYQLVFWVIVLAHQLAALDFVLGWVLVRKVAAYF